MQNSFARPAVTTLVLIAAFKCMPGSNATQLTQAERLCLTLSYPEDLVEHRREIRLVLRPDSTRGDSLFGKYEGDLAALGTRVGAPSGDQRRFHGWFRNQEAEFELSPDIADRGLHIQGSHAGAIVSGNWITESRPRLGGSFSLTHAKATDGTCFGNPPLR
jgi:hypothetical protein